MKYLKILMKKRVSRNIMLELLILVAFGVLLVTNQTMVYKLQKLSQPKPMHCLLNGEVLYEFDEQDKASAVKCFKIMINLATRGVDAETTGVRKLKQVENP